MSDIYRRMAYRNAVRAAFYKEQERQNEMKKAEAADAKACTANADVEKSSDGGNGATATTPKEDQHMQQLVGQLQTIYDEFKQAREREKQLYEACGNCLNPWGDAERLAYKLRAISNVCGDKLEKSFTKFDKNKTVIESYRFKGNVDELYLFVATYLINNAPDGFGEIKNVGFDYSWDEVTTSVRNTVDCALRLNDLMVEAVRAYNAQYVKDFNQNTRLPSCLKLSSALLHYHFPQGAFLYVDKLRYKASKLFLAKETCKVGNVVVPNEIKEELFLRYINVINYLRDEFVSKDAFATQLWTMDYVNFCAYVYVLGCYIKERVNVCGDTNMFALAVYVIGKVED